MPLDATVGNLGSYGFRALLLGLGATLVFDLWGQFLKYAFKIPPSNICLVGRWLAYMPKGVFRHTNITSVPRKRGECTLGWVAHYTIGITFAVAFTALVGNNWLQHPTPVPAVVYGLVTVLAPFLIMQPAFGLGVAASKTPHPMQARVRSLMNHTAFGAGLYICTVVLNWWL